MSTCDAVTCDGGHCVSDEAGVRCECGDDLCLDPDDRLRCVQCPDTDGDGDRDADIDDAGDSDGDADTDTDADNDIDGDGEIDADGDSDSDSDGDADGNVDGDVDDDADGDSDSDGDSDGDVPARPVITAIDGTFDPPNAVNPWSDEDTAAWDTYADVREPAPHRIDTTSPMLVISGENLEDTETVVAEHPEGGTIEFVVEEDRTMEQVRVRFPPGVSTSMASVLLTLTLTTSVGRAQERVFFVQGRDGTNGTNGADGADGEDCAASVLECLDGTCTLGQNLVVEGSGTFESLEATSGIFDTLDVEELTVLESVWLPECPRGYLRDETRDDIVLCTDGRDEMVKVGDFWVDRYEASVWADAGCTTGFRVGVPYGTESVNYPGTFLASGQIMVEENLLYACSVMDVRPSGYLTWFQAQSACAASGKSLITNSQWQAAVAGTVDPGTSTADVGACRTGGVGSRLTGRAGATPGGAGSCISLWGVEDMIGNHSEWTADWWEAGLSWMEGHEEYADSWPDGYSGDNEDGTWNLNGHVFSHVAFRSGLPAAGLRGGCWGDGAQGGAFALYLGRAPSSQARSIGFRCARSH